MEKVSSGKIGRFEIIGVLGRGTTGEVILAQDENLRRRVAIKRPYRADAARFRFEARAATLLHPNIPAVYEIGVDDDLPFIAMEYVEGETLETIIASGRELDLIAKLRIMEQVCTALSYAHEHGVFHRDIKPARIIVKPDGTTKITGFGMARLAENPPLTGEVRVDGRADILAAGGTLFILLTGRQPFSGGETAASFKNDTRMPPAALPRDLPPVLEEIVKRSLAANPGDGFQAAEDFADALHAVIKRLLRVRVTGLFHQAEQFAAERRFAPALQLLDEAMRLDPSNSQGRKLRKTVREQQDRIRRAGRLAACLLKSDEALRAGNFDEALNHLNDALALDPPSAEIRSRIEAVEEAQRRFESSAHALADAQQAQARGNIGVALDLITRALEDTPENERLHNFKAVLIRELEMEAQRCRLLELQENAAGALAARDFQAAEKLLREAAAIDTSNANTRKLRSKLARARELEQDRALLEEIQQRVYGLLRDDAYEEANQVVNRALGKLPGDPLLHRLKAEVEAEASKYDVRRIVDLAISQATELFPSSPLEALAVIEKMLENFPGDERLTACERSLRQQLKARRPGAITRPGEKKGVSSEEQEPPVSIAI